MNPALCGAVVNLSSSSSERRVDSSARSAEEEKDETVLETRDGWIPGMSGEEVTYTSFSGSAAASVGGVSAAAEPRRMTVPHSSLNKGF